MIAIDTDVLGLAIIGKDPYATRMSAIPLADRGIPVVVAEEHLRGRLDQVRKAEAGKSKLTLADAYFFLMQTLDALRRGTYLPFTQDADDLVAGWKAARMRVKPMDMRIAATATVHGVPLVNRNARDFRLIPGLLLDVWP